MLDWVGKSWSAHSYVPLTDLTTGKMIGLPSEFACFGEGSKGGGVIQVRCCAAGARD